MNDLNAKDTIELETLPGIKKIVLLERTSSTQEVARELATQGDMEGTLILSLTQDAGKGRMGRAWESSRGGIYMTLILQPNIGLKFLTETSSINKTPNWILLGVGVNLNNAVSLETGVSVSEILKKEVSREEFLQVFFENFWHIYSAWEFSSESKS